MPSDRQTDRQTDILITIFRTVVRKELFGRICPAEAEE